MLALPRQRDAAIFPRRFAAIVDHPEVYRDMNSPDPKPHLYGEGTFVGGMTIDRARLGAIATYARTAFTTY